MNRPPTLWINTGLAVLLAAAGGGAWFSLTSSTTPTTTSSSRTSTVRTGTLSATVTGSGNLESASTSSVAFGSSGTVTDVFVTVGQTVAKGARLARIDTSAAERTLASAKASLLSARAAYDDTADGQSASQRKRDEISVAEAKSAVSTATSTLSTARATKVSDTKKLDAAVTAAQAALKAGTGTAAEVTTATNNRTTTLAKDQSAINAASSALSSAQDNYELQKLSAAENADSPTAADLAKAKAAVAEAEATVDQAQEALDHTTIVAPAAGTVLSIAGKVGDTVASSSGSSSGSTSGNGTTAGAASSGTSSGTGSSSFVELADLTRLEVTASVAEADAADVEVGQPATVTLSASSTDVAGSVTAISISGTTTSNVVNYPVTVSLTEVPEGVRLGASVSVSITTGSAEDALIVPTSAVTTIGSRHTVRVLANGAERTVPVEIGIEGDSGVQITSGLTAGQVVVLTSTSSGSISNGFPGGGAGAGFGGPPAGVR